MSRIACARVALALSLSFSPTEAAEPVEGGLSSRLAPLQSSLARGKAAFAGDLASTLERSRNEAHELIDQLADSGDLSAWLEAMSVNEDGNRRPGLGTELAGASPEQVKAALHSRVERKLSGYGREIQASLDREDAGRLEASFLVALNDLGREESNLVGSLDDGEDADVDAPAAPKGSWGRDERRDGRFDGRGGPDRRDGRFDGRGGPDRHDNSQAQQK